MLLTIDIGNTNIVFGVFEDKKLVNHWRIVTHKDKTEDEYGILIENLYRAAKIDMAETKGVIVSRAFAKSTFILPLFLLVPG
jgi:type III pantothenate kinase